MSHSIRQGAGGGASLADLRTSTQVLEQLGAQLAQCPSVDLEFSIRLKPGVIAPQGRFSCWVAGHETKTDRRVANLLESLYAPSAVLTAQRQVEMPARQGVGVDLSQGEPEFRFYLHDRLRRTLVDRYRAWRWRPGSEAEFARYRFYFFPEAPDAPRPLELLSDPMRAAFTRLFNDDRLQRGGGYWLREGGETSDQPCVDQIDFTFPWLPPAGKLAGLQEICKLLQLDDAFTPYHEMPIRHIATRPGSSTPVVTLYTSAPHTGTWPADETMLQAQVCRRARSVNARIEANTYAKLPPMPARPSDTHEPLGLDRFYSGPVAQWQAVLGPNMHYHAGIFEGDDHAPDDASMEAALERAVTELYPFIPSGGRLYDVGCGWGGPLSMWVRDLQCRALGLTNSKTQFRHIASLGLPVRYGDAEQTLPPGSFDCVVLLESFTHIAEKERLLRVLRVFSNRLVMRVNCQDAAPAGRAFGESMHMISSVQLKELLEAAGWRIQHWRDRRREALPSVAVWHRRLQSIPRTDDRHLEVLRAWCARVVAIQDAWVENNPLIEVVAK